MGFALCGTEELLEACSRESLELVLSIPQYSLGRIIQPQMAVVPADQHAPSEGGESIQAVRRVTARQRLGTGVD